MKIKKIIATLLPISLGLSPLSIASITSCSNSTSFNAKDVKFYMLSTSNVKDQRLYFSESLKGIPFIDLNDVGSFYKTYFGGLDPKASMTVETNGSVVKLTRENGSSMLFNFDDNTIYCEDINLFKAAAVCKIGLDMSNYDDSFYDSEGKKIEGQVRFATLNGSLHTKAEPMYVDLSTYNIKMYKQGDKYLVPFATFYNVAGFMTIGCLFNGQDLFLVPQQITDAEYLKQYYSFEQQTRSKELALYNYYEFCRDLDYTYGLAKEHNISKFDTFMTNNGLKDLLLSDSRYDEDKAYNLLQYSYIADSHTGFTLQNAYGGYDAQEATKITGEIEFDQQYLQKYIYGVNQTAIRKVCKNIDATTGAVLKPIQLVEDENHDYSLILTFDTFVNKDPDFYYSDSFKTYEQKAAVAATGDTVAIVSLANDIIKDDIATGASTIKNVVIDLSANHGGMAPSALFVLGWLDSAVAQLVDPINNCSASLSYKTDTNFDKVVDQNDKLVSQSGKSIGYTGKVYCLTTKSSFSCGNLVPAMLKQSQMARLVGTKSGGGACLVHVTGTADGSGLCFSSNQKLCYAKNGSYYSIDEGVEPDYYLDDPAIMYGDDALVGDRSKLIAYLNSL